MKRNRLVKIVVVLAVLAISIWLLPLEKPGMTLARRSLAGWFSSVPQITPAELNAWLNDPNRPQPQLLDIRTEAEFNVSHLAQARRVDEKATTADVLPLIDTNRSVVVYCALGYRACMMAKRLQTAGITNIYNLDGAIFAWASENRPMLSAGKPVTTVHPYNWAGRKFIEKKYQAD